MVKRKTRSKNKKSMRKSRKKRGGGVCKEQTGKGPIPCISCITTKKTVKSKWGKGTREVPCLYNTYDKECRSQNNRKGRRNGKHGWRDDCEMDPKVRYYRRLGPSAPPMPKEEKEEYYKKYYAFKDKKKKYQRIKGLYKKNGMVNSNSNYEGHPCFTKCEHKGWCEAGVKGACDWENYCYPSNVNGNGKLEGVDKQYCDIPGTKYDGGKRKSRRRKSRRRKSRKKRRNRKKRTKRR